MLITKKVFILALLGAFLIGGCASRQPELGARLDEYLTRLAPFGFSGALLVAKDGEIVINKGYGMAIKAEGIPNTDKTVFSVGSITKQFTAAGIMKLEMQGKLNTQDPISKYLEGVPEDKQAITLHHLLTHTAGVLNYTGRDYDAAERDETVQKILQAPLLFPPGERFEYSNAGYSLLAAILEIVSGQPYEEYLHGQLFKPAGMSFTGYRLPHWDERVVAHWYTGGTDNSTPLEKPYPYWNLLGNGGILSTTADMHQWILALGSNAVLSAEARKKLFTPFLNDYAYGWDVLKTERGTLIKHDGGSDLGNAAEVRWYADQDVIIVIFCNQDGGTVLFLNGVNEKIETIVFGGDVAIPPAVVESDPAALRKFEGHYQLPSGGRFNASVENSLLRFTPVGQDAINLLAFPEQDNLSLYSDLNSRSQAIVDGIAREDLKLLEEALAHKERIDRYGQFLSRQLRSFEENLGPTTKLEILGTIPAWWSKNDDVATIVRVNGERGSFIFRLHWSEDKIIALGGSMISQPIIVAFAPLTDNVFAGYHIGMAKTMRISFNTTDGGVVTGLTVHTKTRDVAAQKM